MFIETCEEELKEMPVSSVKHYGSTTKGFMRKLEILNNDYQNKMREEASHAINTQKETERGPTVEETIQRGDETIKRTH
jgi:hypothetical protein